MKNKLRGIGQALLKHKILVLVCVILLVAVYVCFPRNVGNLLLKDQNITGIKLVYTVADERGGETVELSQAQQTELMEAFNDSYVRHKVFRKRSASENIVGYYVLMTGSNDMVYFFTKDIISVNGKQYKIYGKGLSEKFLSILEKAKAA